MDAIQVARLMLTVFPRVMVVLGTTIHAFEVA